MYYDYEERRNSKMDGKTNLTCEGANLRFGPFLFLKGEKYVV